MFLNRGDSINDAGTVVVLELHKLQVIWSSGQEGLKLFYDQGGHSKWLLEGICLNFFVYLSGEKLQSQRAELAVLGSAAVNPQPVLPSTMFGRFQSSSPKIADLPSQP